MVRHAPLIAARARETRSLTLLRPRPLPLQVPACLLPIIVTLLWGQRKAKKAALLARPHNPAPAIKVSRNLKSTAVAIGRPFLHFGKECDAVGLVLIATALSLILLPLGLAKASSRGWQTPSMIVMIVLGVVVFLPAFIVWEIVFAERFGVLPIAPSECRLLREDPRQPSPALTHRPRRPSSRALL